MYVTKIQFLLPAKLWKPIEECIQWFLWRNCRCNRI